MDSLIITDATIETSTNDNIPSNDNYLHRHETSIEELISEK